MGTQPPTTTWRKRIFYLGGASLAAMAAYKLYKSSNSNSNSNSNSKSTSESQSKLDSSVSLPSSSPSSTQNDDDFKHAATAARALRNISVEDQLRLYALFKQASGEEIPKKKPSLLDMRGRAKHDAWEKVRTLSVNSAKAQYIATVAKLNPKPNASGAGSSSSGATTDAGNAKLSLESASPMGKVVSVLETLGSPGKSWVGEENEPSYLAKHGNATKLEALVRADPSLVSKRDSEGLAAIHWACDNGSVEMVKKLLALGCEVDLQDGEGLTPLAYAVINDHSELALYLVKQGADVQAKDMQGETVTQMASGSPDMQRVLQAI